MADNRNVTTGAVYVATQGTGNRNVTAGAVYVAVIQAGDRNVTAAFVYVAIVPPPATYTQRSSPSAQMFTSMSGALWVQPGGPNTRPYYLSCHDLDAISEPGSGIGELIRCFDQMGGWKIIGQTESAPDVVVTSIETVMGPTADWLEKVECPMPIYVNIRECGRADIFDNFVRSFILQQAEIGDMEITDAVYREEDEPDILSFRIMAIPPVFQAFPLGVWRVTNSETSALNDIAFTTDVRCAGACGPYRDAGDTGYAVGDTSAVLRSIDGGVTWAATAADPFAGAENVSSVVLFYMGRDTLRVLVARGTTDAGAPAEVAYSDDGGVTWTQADAGTTNGQYATRGGTLFALNFYNIWLAATDGYLYKSEDGGVTWTAQQSGGLTSGNYNSIHFANEQIGFAGADADVIVKTRNGGDTWTACTATGGGGAILCVFTLDEYRVWVGTDAGDIFYSNDGGTTWTERTVNGITTGTIADIQFSNDLIGYLVHNTTGPVGRVYRTINGGYSWQDLDLVTNAGLNAVSVIDDNRLFSVGEPSGGTAVILEAIDYQPGMDIDFD